LGTLPVAVLGAALGGLLVSTNLSTTRRTLFAVGFLAAVLSLVWLLVVMGTRHQRVYAWRNDALDLAALLEYYDSRWEVREGQWFDHDQPSEPGPRGISERRTEHGTKFLSRPEILTVLRAFETQLVRAGAFPDAALVRGRIRKLDPVGRPADGFPGQDG